jgi:starch phosphorylase
LAATHGPFQIVYAGKAHPRDTAGKALIQRIVNARSALSDAIKLVYLENYNIALGKLITSGVDVWLNTPQSPLEASGTSGMKAALNGVPQLGTLDGWWAEGFTGENGWAIPEAPADADADDWDMNHTLELVEHEIVPLFYRRVSGKVSPGWASMMKHAIAVAGRRFTSRRMLRDYVTGYYVPAAREANGREVARPPAGAAPHR